MSAMLPIDISPHPLKSGSPDSGGYVKSPFILLVTDGCIQNFIPKSLLQEK